MNTDVLDTIQGEVAEVLAQVDRAAIEGAAADLDDAGRIFVVGAGRSGFMANAFAMRLVHLGLSVHVIGEATAPSLTEEDTVVAVSGSGTTAGTVGVAEEASRAGCRLLAVTTDGDAPLAGLANRILHLPASTKHRRAGETTTVQPLSSLFDQCVHLVFDAVCLHLAWLRRIDNASAKKAHVTTE